jgi:hypothetical protein
LKALVGILGVLIVLGTALVIGVVIQRIYARPAAASMSAEPVGVAPAGAAPAGGERIAGIAGAGGYVAVWETGPDGDRILTIDPATGAVKTVMQLPGAGK